MKRRRFDTRHNSNQHGSNASDMHRNFSMSGSGTRGNEMGRARIGAEDDDIRNEQSAEADDLKEERTDTGPINDADLQASNDPDFTSAGTRQTSGDYPDTGHTRYENGYDTGSGAGNTDYVGRGTGQGIDESFADTTPGGHSAERRTKGADADSALSGERATGKTTGSGGTSSGYDDVNPGPTPQEAGRVSTTLSGESATLSDEDRAAGRTGGSGAYTNDNGARLDDIPTGTGSAQRGNRAGMEDENTGKISGGTATSTGMGDAGSASPRSTND